MLVAPSDHVIPDAAAFRVAVLVAAPSARSGQLVTFGIRHDSAETGYGWLTLTEPPTKDFDPVPQPLKAFVEKPDTAKAEALLAGGEHLCNAGNFLFSNDTLITAFKEHAPAMLANVTAAVEGAEKDLGFTRLTPEPWAGLQDASIDYAVMEKA
jgi:mannose-1-phosphate guanylyltransferase/mannose-6-phosphate isomerase